MGEDVSSLMFIEYIILFSIVCIGGVFAISLLYYTIFFVRVRYMSALLDSEGRDMLKTLYRHFPPRNKAFDLIEARTYPKTLSDVAINKIFKDLKLLDTSGAKSSAMRLSMKAAIRWTAYLISNYGKDKRLFDAMDALLKNRYGLCRRHLREMVVHEHVVRRGRMRYWLLNSPERSLYREDCHQFALAYMMSGLLFWLQGDVRQATLHYSHAITIYPENAECWLRLADIYEFQGDVHKAAQFRRQLRKLNQKSVIDG